MEFRKSGDIGEQTLVKTVLSLSKGGSRDPFAGIPHRQGDRAAKKARSRKSRAGTREDGVYRIRVPAERAGLPRWVGWSIGLGATRWGYLPVGTRKAVNASTSRQEGPNSCNNPKGKTPRGPKIFYSFSHKELRAFRASRARRIPARFVQHGP
jgi:hypothetical protein